MKASTYFLGACASLALLSGCGGSKSSSSVVATVSSVSFDQVAYRKNTTMTIIGQNLTQGLTVTNPGCLSIGEVTGGTATKRSFLCKIIAVGTFNATVTNSAGAQVYFATLTSTLANRPQVTLTTNMGKMVVELNPGKAPVTVDNFLNYVEAGTYANSIFHRVDSTVIQGGGYNTSLQLLPALSSIVFEGGLSNVRGTIGMARGTDVNSATSQFYFNRIDNSAIYDSVAATSTAAATYGYTVFGTIVSGLPVMDAIGAVPTSVQGSLPTAPVTQVVITGAVQTL
ncbi:MULTISPECIES: peptidylprolyl isomerase [unclassified Undibacterium]|uniref:peptidylprolyl isomerase n=1 Tax=unclassified Undibacterium TaxID=2630295 RepID=UPI002AC8A4FF|nr:MULTISPECIES: peptidylprolyl isomerase [unclassified Undibacterium]MEB0138708.1 peptidylprolyl isomerase [Undibacterium sp. CCC2.1]MEB0171509.1 peptidylprolyl isomerase [Undibacterium sp. CCC1.1]MEB0175420.1 peptidylprolyl isomerase [Undibacterium sp. CCC3.4]MEB0214709.1 peptidylprolyl isomerase [Undibacterium sp. 5I2]WPX43332.1 peptidylprolyl isomerase [Undibacterium sp. CCC3.4]